MANREQDKLLNDYASLEREASLIQQAIRELLEGPKADDYADLEQEVLLIQQATREFLEGRKTGSPTGVSARKLDLE